jgi:hypothetical protein
MTPADLPVIKAGAEAWGEAKAAIIAEQLPHATPLVWPVSREMANLMRQWYDAVTDLNPAYLRRDDHELARACYGFLDMPVPLRISALLSPEIDMGAKHELLTVGVLLQGGPGHNQTIPFPAPLQPGHCFVFRVWIDPHERDDERAYRDHNYEIQKQAIRQTPKAAYRGEV